MLKITVTYNGEDVTKEALILMLLWIAIAFAW
jgi:hypothetical protein